MSGNVLKGALLSTALVFVTTANAQVEAGDDFFAYANRAWLETTEIPVGKVRWTAANEIGEQTRVQVLRLLDDAADAPARSTARKVADFRAGFLDEAGIEARGLAPIKPMLDRIGRVGDKASLTRLLGSGLRADVEPMNAGTFDSSHLLGLSVEAGTNGEKEYVAFLVQGGLGLPTREHYLDTSPAMQASRARYEAAVGSALVKAGIAPAAAAPKRARAVVTLEAAIAESHATAKDSANERNADNLWTRADFMRFAPGMDWGAFFSAAGLNRQQAFVAWQPGAVKGAAALVSSQAIATWKDYLRVRVIAAYADVLPQALRDLAPALRGVGAPSSTMPRANEVTKSALGDAIGRMYVERHFRPASRQRVREIAAEVRSSFVARVQAATWMSPSTRAMALAKLKVMYFGVGYPEQQPDLSNLEMNAADPVGNLRRVADRRYRQTIARLGKPVDNTEWSVVPQWPGALLMFQQNSYNFTAALLQPPKFDATASDAANYGAIGAIVGHEMSHFVDTLGAEYAADGRFRNWWSAEDASRFEALCEPLVKQFSAYHPIPGQAIDGRLTLTENVADLGGLAAAFDAHRASLGGKASDREYTKQQDREFFLGFARAWRSKYRDEGLRAQLTNDHAPEAYRVATVRNIDAWYDAFDVRPGHRLYLEPAARVRIW